MQLWSAELMGAAMLRALPFVLSALLVLLPVLAYGNSCTTGKPCGDTCIEWSDTCHVDEGGDAGLVVLAIVGGAAVLALVVFALVKASEAPPPADNYAATARYVDGLPSRPDVGAKYGEPPAPSIPSGLPHGWSDPPKSEAAPAVVATESTGCCLFCPPGILPCGNGCPENNDKTCPEAPGCACWSGPAPDSSSASPVPPPPGLSPVPPPSLRPASPEVWTPPAPASPTRGTSCYDRGSACGCSGLRKAQCGGECCTWTKGVGCGCR